MSPRARRRAWTALGVVIVLLLLLLSQCSPDSPVKRAQPADGDFTIDTGHGTTFTVTGRTVHPISPGTSAPFNAVLTNLSDHALVVTAVRLTLSDVVAPRSDAAHPCTIGDFTVVQSSSNLSIELAEDASTSLLAEGISPSEWPRVAMTNTSSNQDGCKGAVLRFDNTATGRRIF